MLPGRLCARLSRVAGVLLVILTVMAPAPARASKQTRCDNQIWFCGMDSMATIGPGTALPGEAPSLAHAGLIWLGPGGAINELLRSRPGGEDSLAISYAFEGQSRLLVNTNALGQFDAPFAGGTGDRVRYAGSNGEIALEVSYYLPDLHPTAGVVFVTARVTNLTTGLLENVALGRGFNPHFQTDATTFNDALTMTRPLGSAVIAELPAPATTAVSAASSPTGVALLVGSLDPAAIASVEGNLLLDPADVLGSPRDPAGAIEDTALNVAQAFGNLAPGQSASLRLVLVAGTSPQEVLDVYRSIPEPSAGVLVVLAIPALAMAIGRLPARTRRNGI